MNDPQVDALRARVDQACEANRELAREAAAYYHGLRSKGVPRILAGLLVRDWHAWRQAPDPDELL